MNLSDLKIEEAIGLPSEILYETILSLRALSIALPLKQNPFYPFALKFWPGQPP
jgi:hypothetical protein